jgi:hypothetical protein
MDLAVLVRETDMPLAGRSRYLQCEAAPLWGSPKNYVFLVAYKAFYPSKTQK